MRCSCWCDCGNRLDPLGESELCLSCERDEHEPDRDDEPDWDARLKDERIEREMWEAARS